MRMPHGEEAIVDLRKLEEYVLSPTHFRGQHKARVFYAVLGMEAKDADELQAALLAAARTTEAALSTADEYGQRYVVDFRMNRSNGLSATIRSNWIIRSSDTVPRFVTCYVLN